MRKKKKKKSISKITETGDGTMKRAHSWQFWGVEDPPDNQLKGI